MARGSFTFRRPSITAADAGAAGAAVLLGGLAGAAAAFGPLYAVGALLALLVGWAMLTSVETGMAAAFGIMTLLPFATLPFRAIITPTLLSLALLALMGVWVLRMLAR